MKPLKISQICCYLSLMAIVISSNLPRGIFAQTPPFKLHLSQPNEANFWLAFSGFTDVGEIEGSTEIQQLAQLGVIETDSNTFRPLEPITRGQFVAWLVKAYNQLHKTPIRLSRGTTSAFPDVAPSNSYFIYIQSAYEAGFVVGFDDRTFKPNELLTREQMIALKSQLDSKGFDRRDADTLLQYISKTKGFTDVEQMSEQYLKYIAFDLGNAAGGRNFERVYGSTRIYGPKRPVTRAEAAILLSKFRKGKSLTEALERP
ncbi:S-layer homology domain-containing protein [Crocosphaera sp. XPORK-15E]|uniref:S-layer homology domain-containing protein n=1 Tax=Crocosphaera sp. XPORK-15E TaxID=3110247 RepID=UPI002B208921|nr:S-layer homology domain-containing protein [Crocosphaera sp. XPORK-15E]MEA5534844.1 S-layer homology domain-containing protein [Crocosphaera sp. XPORK-15E]